MKPGVRTSELWLTIAASALIGFGAVPVPDKFKWIPIAAMVAGYAISRGLAKYEGGPTPPVFGAGLPPESVDPLGDELAAQKAIVAAATPKPRRRAPKKKAS